jgi:hypothetical protein
MRNKKKHRLRFYMISFNNVLVFLRTENKEIQNQQYQTRVITSTKLQNNKAFCFGESKMCLTLIVLCSLVSARGIKNVIN